MERNLTYLVYASLIGADNFTYAVNDGELTAEATVHIHFVQTSISRWVYNDANTNDRDDGEDGLADVIVQLQDTNGSLTIGISLSSFDIDMVDNAFTVTMP